MDDDADPSSAIEWLEVHGEAVFSGIRSRFIEVEGEDTDHWTTSTVQESWN